MQYNNIRGTLLLATEGINGTVASSREGIEALLTWFAKDERLQNIVTKESYEDSNPFYRTKVKLKKEIVTMGVDGIDPKRIVGTYVEPQQWNDLISDPDVVLVDTRNQYEVEIGTFKNAVNPATDTFREFPEYVKQNLDPQKHKKVAMFCTGGIRCEKSTAFARAEGVEDVFHLKGGILNYLEHVPESESLWRGECFVFDERVSVGHGLAPGDHGLCRACRRPLDHDDMAHAHYVEGVSCPRCYPERSDEQRARYAERHRQAELARARGEEHIGRREEPTTDD
jgi:UPF0176 protein